MIKPQMHTNTKRKTQSCLSYSWQQGGGLRDNIHNYRATSTVTKHVQGEISLCKKKEKKIKHEAIIQDYS